MSVGLPFRLGLSNQLLHNGMATDTVGATHECHFFSAWDVKIADFGSFRDIKFTHDVFFFLLLSE